MATKTASGLIEYAKAQVGLPYWFGTYGQTASSSLYSSQKKQYPAYYTASDFASQYGKRVHDCSGLIKGYLWSDSPTSKPTYKSSQDYDAQKFYTKATKKGSISSVPSEAGVLVFNGSSTSKITHVGILDGNGYVYEAKGHAYGVQKNKFAKSNWIAWGYSDLITYNGSSSSSTSSSGSSGSTTKSSGTTSSTTSSSSKLEVDGYWGKETTKAVQKKLSTEVDGTVSHQYSSYKSSNPGLLSESWKWESKPSGYSPMVKALQKKLSVTQDGYIGPKTIKALQKKMGTTQDGCISKKSPCVKQLQTNLNAGKLW